MLLAFPPARRGGRNHGRDVTTFLTKFTVEFPIADGLLFPYLTGGGGIGRVTERHSVGIDPTPWIPWEDNQTTGQAVGTDDAVHFSDAGVFLRPTAYSDLGLALCSAAGLTCACVPVTGSYVEVAGPRWSVGMARRAVPRPW